MAFSHYHVLESIDKNMTQDENGYSYFIFVTEDQAMESTRKEWNKGKLHIIYRVTVDWKNASEIYKSDAAQSAEYDRTQFKKFLKRMRRDMRRGV